MRARRLAPSPLAARSAASVRFTPSRASSLSPRRASLLAGASPARTPAPAGPLLHHTTARPDPAARVASIAARHSAGIARDALRRVVDAVKASATHPP